MEGDGRADPGRHPVVSGFPRPRGFRLRLRDVYGLLVYVAIAAALSFSVPAGTVRGMAGRVVFAVGAIAVWRWLWWLTHALRAMWYRFRLFPALRKRADDLWDAGWRPRVVHFMVTTFRERAETTEQVFASIFEECRSMGVLARVYVGTGDPSDERAIGEVVARRGPGRALEVVIVRQNRPGKRAAIGLTLRAISRGGVDDSDPVVFMDGDCILEPGFLRKCLPLFAAHPRLDALTTAERPIVHGPRWLESWLELRFAQRHLTMQSHSVSGKVLTLTGRCSVFRAADALREDFIRTVEADSLDHWLWGRIPFLSGDDKSTWFCLLKKPGGSTMIYVPDAVAYTIEHVEGNGIARMRFNLLRWSGNLLRNGARAIALGPRQVGGFIWWCIVDQRIAMWTGLVGPVACVLNLLAGHVGFVVAYLAWILWTRLLVAAPLWIYTGRIVPSFPVFMYLNQVSNSVIKIYLLFRPATQRWLNRGNQRAGPMVGPLRRFQSAMATYLAVLAVGVFALGIALYVGVIRPPSWFTIQQFTSPPPALASAAPGDPAASGDAGGSPFDKSGGPTRAGAIEDTATEPVEIGEVSDSKALGYVNNHKFLVDATGTAWFVVRSKRQGGMSICLYRSAGRWYETGRFESAWIEDRPGVDVSSAPQRPASIAAADDGSIHLVWYGGSALAPAHQIRYARFAADPALRVVEESEPFPVSGFELAYPGIPGGDELWQEHPCIAAGPDGLYLVWEARDPSRRNPSGALQPGVAWAVRGADGTWSPNGPLATPPYAQVDASFPSQSRPTILAGAAGEMHVFCYGSVGGVQQILHGVLKDRRFSGWSIPCPSPNDQRHVCAALDPSGRAHFAWREGGADGVSIRYAMLDERGRAGAPVRVSPAGENASTPSLTVSGGSVWIAWVAWAPGAVNSEGRSDNGFPADAATVEGRLETCSKRIGAAAFGPVTPLDGGPVAYPTWARRGDAGAAPEALLWTRLEHGTDGAPDRFRLLLSRNAAR
jgi:mannuronan synthase